MEHTKSIIVTDFGGYDCLKVVDYPLSKPENDEIEIEVCYCGLNFADLYTRQGLISNRELPFILGMECSGVITALGPNAHNFQVGQKVVCYNYTGGLYRFKVIIKASKCYPVPNNVSLKDAAALTVNYLTAYFSVMELGRLRPKQNILINSCAGGVGWAATQLASLVDGVTLYGTTSPLKTRQVKENGINYVLSYENLQEQVEMLCPNGLDLILENEAGQNLSLKKQLLKPFGRIVFIGSNEIIRDEKKICLESLTNNNNISLTSLIINSISVSGLHLGIVAEKNPMLFKEKLNELFELLVQKKICPKIDSVWPFEDVVEATKLLQERRNVGKVLLTTGRII